MCEKKIIQRLGITPGSGQLPDIDHNGVLYIKSWDIVARGSIEYGTLTFPAKDSHSDVMIYMSGVNWRQVARAVWRLWAFPDRPMTPLLKQIIQQNSYTTPS